MKSLKRFFNIVKNERGVLTIDTVFAFSLVGGAMILSFAICVTLAVVEVAQYVAYSTSRAYAAGNSDESAQQAQAEAKFGQLIGQSGIKNLANSGWFSLTFEGAGDKSGEFGGAGGGGHNPFWGTVISVDIKVLNLRIPFFGSTSEQGSFKTKVNSLLGREPTNSECMGMNAERFNRLKAITGSGSGSAYFPIGDNGC